MEIQTEVFRTEVDRTLAHVQEYMGYPLRNAGDTSSLK